MNKTMVSQNGLWIPQSDIVVSRRRFLKTAAGLSVGLLGFPAIIRSGTAEIIDLSGDKAILLQNAAFVRPFDIPSWNTIRIGIRHLNTGTASLGTLFTPRFWFGIQSGTSDTVLDTSTTNYIGFRSTQTWNNFIGTTPNQFYSVSTELIKKVGSTVSLSTSGTNRYPGESTAANFASMFVQFTKGSPNWTRHWIMPSAGPTGSNLSRDNFLSVMASPVWTLLSNGDPIPNYTSSQTTFAFDEVAGVLNAVTVAWDRTEIDQYITDIAIAKAP